MADEEGDAQREEEDVRARRMSEARPDGRRHADAREREQGDRGPAHNVRFHAGARRVEGCGGAVNDSGGKQGETDGAMAST